MSNKQAVEEDWDVHFVYLLIVDIVDDMVFSNFLAANTTAPYVRYIKVKKMKIENNGMLSLLICVSGDSFVTGILHITYFDDTILNNLSEEDILMKIQDVEAFVKSDWNPLPFHANEF